MIAIKTKFELGRLLITPAARDALSSEDVNAALRRHAMCDWGDVCPDDWQANDEALEDEARLFSVYHATDGTKFWMITQSTREATIVLLPDHY